jgi:membrane protease subunit HflC
MKNTGTGYLLAAAVLIVLLAVFLIGTMAYTVPETHYALVIEFGKVVKAVDEPGLHFKKPFIQSVVKFEKWIIAWDGFPSSMPTKDKKSIFVDVWARWRIMDPIKFRDRATNVEGGHKLLDDYVDSAVRDVVGRYNLIELVRSTNRELTYESEEMQEEQEARNERISVGREKITDEIIESASRSLQGTGMELVDVGIKRINYVESVRKSVYERMQSERYRIAELYKSEAQEKRRGILGETEKELEAIRGEGKSRSTQIRGEADAEVIRMYADALSRSPEFYSFLRKLDAYKKSLGKDTTLILTTDSDFLRGLKTPELGE